MTQQTYRSKPQYVEAIQWTGSNYEDLYNVFGADIQIDGDGLHLLAGKNKVQGWVDVPEGHYLVHPPSDLSDIWPVEEEYFENKYELA